MAVNEFGASAANRLLPRKTTISLIANSVSEDYRWFQRRRIDSSDWICIADGDGRRPTLPGGLAPHSRNYPPPLLPRIHSSITSTIFWDFYFFQFVRIHTTFHNLPKCHFCSIVKDLPPTDILFDWSLSSSLPQRCPDKRRVKWRKSFKRRKRVASPCGCSTLNSNRCYQGNLLRPPFALSLSFCRGRLQMKLLRRIWQGIAVERKRWILIDQI